MDITSIDMTMQTCIPVYPYLSLHIRTLFTNKVATWRLVMPVVKKGGYLARTGLNNFTAMNDILVDSEEGGVLDPFQESARSHFADAGIAKSPRTGKYLELSPSNSHSLHLRGMYTKTIV